MEVNASDVTFIAYGFLIKYLLKIRANYFGEDIHFQTLEEYAMKADSLPTTDEPPELTTEFTHTKTESDLDVLLYFYVKNGTIALPCNIYSAKSHFLLNFATFDTDIRFTNYYMDLQTNISPIKGIHNVATAHTEILNLSRDHKPFEPSIFIDGIVIHGHRLFGLPPTEPTYFCKWDIDLGSVLINGPLEITQYLEQVISSAHYTYMDSENGLLVQEPIIYDVTYLGLKIKSLKLVFTVENTCMEIASSSISFDFNDLANERYSGRITIIIPELKLGIYEIERTSENKIGRELLASMETSVYVTDFIQKRNFEYCREKQQQHIALHDAPFDRCSFLLDEKHRVVHKKPMGNIIPSIPLNAVPPALTNDTMPFIDPNMDETMAMEDFDDGDSSASSRSQFSTSTGSVPSESSHSERGPKEADFSLKYNFKFAGKEIFGNAFLPPEAWKEFEQIATECKEKLPDFGLNPTSYYSTEENLCPSSNVDNKFEYDSFVIQLGDVVGFASPRGLAGANTLIQSAQRQDLQSAMDKIQVDVFKNLNYIRVGKPEVKNFRVSLSSTEFKYGIATGSSVQEVQQHYDHMHSHISLKCEAVAVALSLKQLKTPQADISEYLAANDSPVPAIINVYAGCQNIMIGAVKGQHDIIGDSSSRVHQAESQPILLQLENPEFWFHEGDTQNSTSTRLRSINLSVVNENLDWVCKFVTHIVEETKKMQRNEEHMKHHNLSRPAYVLHTLSIASELFNIEDDPSVLTRPAFIIQSSRHVRANDSWKIIIRLRHILKCVPSEWRREQDRLVHANEFEVVDLDEAKKDVLNVFNRWRSWEMESLERSYIFRHAFNTATLQETLLSRAMSAVIDLESVAIRLHYSGEEDFICFDYLKVTAGWADVERSVEYSSTTLPVDCSVGCINVRSRFSLKMLHAYQAILPYIEKMTAPASVSPATAEGPLMSLPSSPSYHSASQTQNLPLFSISAMILVQNMSMVVATPTTSFAFETKDTQLSAFVEQLSLNDSMNLGMSLAVYTNHSEFRASERRYSPSVGEEEVVLMSFSFTEYKSSVTSAGPLLTSPKYVMVSTELFQLLLNKPVEYIAQVVVQVLEVDYKILQPFIDDMSVKTAYPQNLQGNDASSISLDSIASSTTSLLSSFGFPLYMSASCNISEIRLNTSPSWCVYIATSRAHMMASVTDANPLACEVDIRDQEIGILAANLVDNESGSVRRVTSVTIPSFSGMILLEERQKEIFSNVIVRVKAFEISTLSVSSVLRLIRSDVTRDEVIKAMSAVKEMMVKVESTFKNSKSAKIGSDPTIDLHHTTKDASMKPFRLNLNASIEQSIVIVPSLDSSLMLDVQNIHLMVSSFSTHPMSVELGFEDMLFNLQNDTWSVQTSTILQLHLQVYYTAESMEHDGKQRIKIKSDHFQVMLCQRVVEKLVEIELYIEEGLAGLDIFSTPPTSQLSPDSPITSTKESSSSDANSAFRALEEFAGRTILQMELRNAVFAWLFEDEISHGEYDSNAKGFLFGYDLLQVTSSALRGRTSLQGVYLTPSFNDVDLFHLRTDKENAVNTAYLPQVNLLMVYTCGKTHPLVSLELSGDSLKISLLPSIVTIVVCAVKSIENTVKSASSMIQKRSHTNDSSVIEEKHTPSDDTIKYSLPFSLHITIGFDGATISLWNPEDVTSISAVSRRLSFNPNFAIPESQTEPVNIPKANTEPSLWLQAPAVDAVIFYTKGETAQERDVLNGEILISSTNNKIYPKVVPCIMEMSKLIKEVLKQSAIRSEKAQDALEKALTDKSLDIDSKISDIDLEEQFGNIIVDLKVRLAAQDLMLSCEPTARVAATVAYEDLFIGLNSSEDGLRKTSYSLSVRLTNFKAYLQHIYSREVSGMLSIESIVLFLIKDRSSSDTQAILVAAKISDINTEINLKQSQDLELFQDIWLPNGSLGDSLDADNSNTAINQLAVESFKQPNEAMMSGGAMRKYRRVTSTNAIPWRIDFSLENVHGLVDLGQAVGQVTFNVDKFWLSSRKSSNWEQNLILGFDEIKLKSEGRLGGIVALRKVQLSTAIMWQRHDGGIHPVPLVQAILGVESVESRISFDFHSFAIISVTALHLSMFNQRDHNYILNDRLAAVGSCKSMSIYATSLAASNILDLYYTLERMRREANASYNAILRDSARPGTDQGAQKEKARRTEFKPFEKLRTFLDFNIGLVSLYIFPDSLVDLQVFTITIRGAEARYSQEIEHKDLAETEVEGLDSPSGSLLDSLSTSSMSSTKKQLVCSLDMKLTELMVALSTYRKPISKANTLAELSIDEYVSKSREAKGGTIIGIPVCDISMQTWQDFDTYNIVDYVFSSSFGGRVDVGWNLGSVTFIKGMWENHTKTFTSRRETYMMRSGPAPGVDVLRSLSNIDDEEQLIGATTSSTQHPPVFATSAQVPSIDELPNANADANTTDSQSQNYVYHPLKPPTIAQPQLRDMGEATPPIEWIGLHRKKLPSLTHQAVIVSLQKMVEEVELMYRRVLGHS